MQRGRRRSGEGDRADVRSMPRRRKSANDKAAPNPRGVFSDATTLRVFSRRVRAVGPRAATDKSPPQSFAGMRRAGRASALTIASSPVRPGW